VRLRDLLRLEFADPGLVEDQGPVEDQVVAAILAGAKTTTAGPVLAQRFRLVRAL
jgi:hypothetical protein